MRVKEKFNQKLLVEGNDDQHVIWALCERFSLTENFDIIDCEGIDKLNEQIPIRFKQSGIKTIGIIIDADADIQVRWVSLRNILINQGFNLPVELQNVGLIVKNPLNQKVGIWIMPNNNVNGMLEDFISFLVPIEDKLFSLANATLKDIEDQKLNPYSLTHKSKALIHTWLSWQKDPGTPMGLGITKRYLTTDENTCSLLINWLTELFEK